MEKQRRGGEFTGMLDVTLGQKLTIDRFYGFEINWWPAKIAETAMFLVDHQANQRLAHAIGQAPDRLPITITAHITHGNALALDWAEVLPEPTGQTFIFGNPPFIGQYTKTAEQTADMKRVWGKDYDGYLDYVTAWHAKALDLYRDRRGEFAYVTTNSITQGQPVPALFAPIYRAGFDIKFAHRTFAWDSQAPGKAAVHCVIIGFTRDKQHPQRLWDYPHPQGEAVEKTPRRGINAYLIDGPKVLVYKSMKPISPEVFPARRGSQPTDGGGLIVEKNEYDEVISDNLAKKYIRPFRMGKELINGNDRWCLWMECLDPADVGKSPVLKSRIEAVRKSRLRSQKKATQKLAETPFLFGENHQPKTDYVGIPAVVSGSRNFYTVSHLDRRVIAGNKVYIIEDPKGLMFGLLSSSMFISWQKAVGGRLKSDLNFSNTIVWNNFPVPALGEKQREEIIAAGHEILVAREAHPDRSLAEHYHPLAMDPALLKAHNALDRVVDMSFGAPKKLATDEQRLEVLFTRYQELAA